MSAVVITIDGPSGSGKGTIAGLLAAKLGDSIVKDASDAEITGMFKALAKDAATTNPVATALRHGVVNVGDAQSLADKALAKANTDLNAWRNQ